MAIFNARLLTQIQIIQTPKKTNIFFEKRKITTAKIINEDDKSEFSIKIRVKNTNIQNGKGNKGITKAKKIKWNEKKTSSSLKPIASPAVMMALPKKNKTSKEFDFSSLPRRQN